MRSVKHTLGIAALSVIMLMGSANAYTLRVTNGLKEPIAVDICGIARIGCSMWQGAVNSASIYGPKQKNLFVWDTPDTIYHIRQEGKTIYYDNAGAVPPEVFNNRLPGEYHGIHKPILLPGETGVFQNNDFQDGGFCWDLTHVYVGLKSEGYSMMTRDIFNLPNNWYNQVFSAAAAVGSTIGEAGEAASAAGEKGKAIGAGVKALGDSFDSVGKLVRAGTCKDIDFIVTEKTGGVVVATKDVG